MLYDLVKPLIYKTDPETAHNMTLKALRMGAVPMCKHVADASLESTVWGLNFPNPVGLSAGFDKTAYAVGASFNMGFGFVEAGTVTPLPQEGNPKPRVFRNVKNEAVINRMGFPNEGMEVFEKNCQDYLRNKSKFKNGILGLNIGMNKTQTEPIEDYKVLIKRLGHMADYMTVNISSPNTPGLRDLQKREFLMELIDALRKEMKAAGTDRDLPPLLVKLAPDLTDEQQEELAQTAIDSGIDGLILGNTTLDRPDYLPEKFSSEGGGLSGQPLTDKSTAVIRNFYTFTKGKIPIVGVGGVSSAKQAYEKIKAGASLVQLYSALVFHGPALPGKINKGLVKLLKEDGYNTISEAVAADHK